MPKMTRRVLKAGQVQWQDPFRLALDPTAGPSPGASSHGSAPAKIRITENHTQFALVEVTCSCGKTTFVRCDYSGPAGSPAPAETEPS